MRATRCEKHNRRVGGHCRAAANYAVTVHAPRTGYTTEYVCAYHLRVNPLGGRVTKVEHLTVPTEG